MVEIVMETEVENVCISDTIELVNSYIGDDGNTNCKFKNV